MNNLHDDKSSSYNKEPLFSRIVKYFSRDSVGIKILFIVGILSLVLGVWQMIFKIKTSFIASPIVLNDKAALIEGLNRLKDTDGDGLSDYDEINTYGTSPYLTDSNSNDISDYDEVILGRGQETQSSSSLVSTVSNSSDNFSQTMLNMNLEDFKVELIKMGYDKTLVAQLTEETANELKNQIRTMSADKATEATSTPSEVEKLQNLSIDEIKALLKSEGATDEELRNISDEQLKAVYLQSLKDTINNQSNNSQNQ